MSLILDVPKKKRNNGTKTSSFGTPGRVNHDSSSFYASKLYDEPDKIITEKSYIEHPIPKEFLNSIICKSSEKMDELPDCSVHLMVTSPPYNVGKDYDDDLSMNEYRRLLKNVFTEVHRVLVPGGRACINLANLGRKPYIPLVSFINQDMLDIGFLMRGEIIWDKGSSASPSTAWGTWLKANNPVLRDVHEYILIYCKETFTRYNPNKRASTIAKEEFLEFTKSVWRFPAVSARKIGHPAPFPEELPYRLLQLYTFEDDIILDPFAGSGTACIAAIKANRNYIGYDIDQEYCNLARKRIKAETDDLTLNILL